MAELFLELFLEFLAFLGFRKRKKNRMSGTEDLQVSECAGCRRRLKKQIYYEWGKTWCKECYKTEVLKISI